MCLSLNDYYYDFKYFWANPKLKPTFNKTIANYSSQNTSTNENANFNTSK